MAVLALIAAQCTTPVVLESQVASEPAAEEAEVVEEAAPAAEPTVLRVGNTAEIAFLDAMKVQSGQDLPHSELLNCRLTLYDPTMMDPKPDLAESWTISDDGLTYVFKLREDALFHTGRNVTAEDVVYSWARSINDIGDKGRGKGELKDVVSYEATGQYEFTVELNKASPVFLASMGHWALPIVDQETIETIDTNPVGCGPYKFVENIPGDRLILEKFPDYYDKEQLARFPDRVVIIPFPEEQTRIASLKAGEIDLAKTVAYQFLEDLRNTEGLHIVEQPGGLTASYMTVAFNLRDPERPTADVRVRQAIQLALDKEAINKAVYFGMGVVGCNFIPENHWAYQPIACPERDVEAARALLAEAGYDESNPLKLTYKPEANELTQKMAEVIKQSLAEAGIEIEIVVLDSAGWLDEVWFGYNFDLTDAWYTREPDPDGLIQSVLRKDLGNNVMGYFNQDIEDWFDAGKSTTDRDVRQGIYKQIIEKVVLEDVPLVKIQTLPVFDAANQHIEGAHVSPKGYFNFKDFTFVP
jgi:peptide/nickel transport system substrate-binding protein